MGEVPHFVVDASTVLKWQFHNEPGTQQAVDLVTDFVGGRVRLIAPHHLPFEFTNVVWHRVLDGDLDRSAGRQMVSDMLALRIPTYHPAGLTLLAFEFTQRYPLSFYDALYVGLMQMYQIPFLIFNQSKITSPHNIAILGAIA